MVKDKETSRTSSARRRHPPLPEGWQACRSKSHPDRVYYFNSQTGATTWDLPLGAQNVGKATKAKPKKQKKEKKPKKEKKKKKEKKRKKEKKKEKEKKKKHSEERKDSSDSSSSSDDDQQGGGGGEGGEQGRPAACPTCQHSTPHTSMASSTAGAQQSSRSGTQKHDGQVTDTQKDGEHVIDFTCHESSPPYPHTKKGREHVIDFTCHESSPPYPHTKKGREHVIDITRHESSSPPSHNTKKDREHGIGLAGSESPQPPSHNTKKDKDHVIDIAHHESPPPHSHNTKEDREHVIDITRHKSPQPPSQKTKKDREHVIDNTRHESPPPHSQNTKKDREHVIDLTHHESQPPSHNSKIDREHVIDISHHETPPPPSHNTSSDSAGEPSAGTQPASHSSANKRAGEKLWKRLWDRRSSKMAKTNTAQKDQEKENSDELSFEDLMIVRFPHSQRMGSGQRQRDSVSQGRSATLSAAVCSGSESRNSGQPKLCGAGGSVPEKTSPKTSGSVPVRSSSSGAVAVEFRAGVKNKGGQKVHSVSSSQTVRSRDRVKSQPVVELREGVRSSLRKRPGLQPADLPHRGRSVEVAGTVSDSRVASDVNGSTSESPQEDWSPDSLAADPQEDWGPDSLAADLFSLTAELQAGEDSSVCGSGVLSRKRKHKSRHGDWQPSGTDAEGVPAGGAGTATEGTCQSGVSVSSSLASPAGDGAAAPLQFGGVPPITAGGQGGRKILQAKRRSGDLSCPEQKTDGGGGGGGGGGGSPAPVLPHPRLTASIAAGERETHTATSAHSGTAASDYMTVSARDSLAVSVRDSPAVFARDSPTVSARDSPAIFSRDSPTVSAWDSPAVSAWDSPTVSTCTAPETAPSGATLESQTSCQGQTSQQGRQQGHSLPSTCDVPQSLTNSPVVTMSVASTSASSSVAELDREQRRWLLEATPASLTSEASTPVSLTFEASTPVSPTSEASSRQHTNSAASTSATTGSRQESCPERKKSAGKLRDGPRCDSGPSKDSTTGVKSSAGGGRGSSGTGLSLSTVMDPEDGDAFPISSAAGDESEEDDMEVDHDYDNDQIMMEIQELRESFRPDLSAEVGGMLWQSVLQAGRSTTPSPSLSAAQLVCVVVDTNVLIGSLAFVQDLRDRTLKGFGRPYLVIPWIVLQELDALKGSHTKSRKARDAVRYLHSCLVSRHPRVRGQTPAEAREAAVHLQVQCNDDHILQCCLLCQSKYGQTSVILLTDDLNLENKAVVMAITTYSTERLKSQLSDVPLDSEVATISKAEERGETRSHNTNSMGPSPQHRAAIDDMVCGMKAALVTALPPVVEREMKEAYGDLWSAVVCLQPPWSARDLVSIFHKHWIAVFGMKFERELKTSVDYLSACLQHSLDTMGTVKKAVEACQHCLVLITGVDRRSDAVGKLEALVHKGEQLLTEAGVAIPSIWSSNGRSSSLSTSSRRTLTGEVGGDRGGSAVMEDHCMSQEGMEDMAPEHEQQHSTHGRSAVQHAVEIQIPKSNTAEEDAAIGAMFQAIWAAIFNCCNNVERLLQQGVGRGEVTDIRDTLTRLLPLTQDMLSHFQQCLSFSPLMLSQRVEAVDKFCCCLNNFLQRANIPASPLTPVTLTCLIVFMRDAKNRVTLSNGLQQLDSMIQRLQTLTSRLPS